MRILVLADIHANWPALSAIKEPFDACVFAGDLVDYGTDPLPCIEWIRTHATVAIRGNHDHAVAQRVAPRTGKGYQELAAATRTLNWDRLRRSHLKYLAQLPVTERVVLDGTSFFLVHGTPRDPLDEYLGDDARAWKARLEGIEADFVCVGHTHVPFHLDLGTTQVINPGSVGQPRDGDWRCAYAVVEDGRVELRRAEYAIDETIRQMRESGLDPRMADFAERVLRNGGRADGEPSAQ